MNHPKAHPKELVATPSGAKVYRFVDGEGHAHSFGFEWTQYSRTYDDNSLGTTLSRSRTELNLGFPLEFLKEKNILEVGCGAGRFTVWLAKYAASVVAVDLSEAVYVNAGLKEKNVVGIQADLMNIPELTKPIDILFCRGVLQHTKDPRASMKRLFDYVPERAIVIFDVYKKNPRQWLNAKYFWRPIFQKFISLESFDRFLQKHAEKLYSLHHSYHKIVSALPPIKHLLTKTPLIWPMSWETQYPHLTHEQRVELFKNELVDTLYAHFDQPQTPDEVIQTLAEIGQIPYSYDIDRNHFRYKKRLPTNPLQVKRTKNGVFPVDLKED